MQNANLQMPMLLVVAACLSLCKLMGLPFFGLILDTDTITQ